MSVDFNVKTLPCDEVKEVFRHANADEMKKMIPQLTKAQLEYVLATLPKEKVGVIQKFVSLDNG